MALRTYAKEKLAAWRIVHGFSSMHIRRTARRSASYLACADKMRLMVLWASRSALRTMPWATVHNAGVVACYPDR